MTIDELRDIDRRVAVELGWTAIRDLNEDVYRGSILGWHTVPVVVGISPKAGGDAGMPQLIPSFTADPRHADLVRQEIERRGWDWSLYSNFGTQSSYLYSCMISEAQGGDLIAPGKWGDSPYIALCLAFLAACEDTKKESEE